jgi:hypothetical protein
MISLYVALFVLLCCIALFYIYPHIQEGYGGGRGGGGMGRGGIGMGRGGMGMGRGIGWSRGGGIGRGWGRGGGYYGGPRRSVFYYPTYVQDYDTSDVYIYPAQNKMAYTPSFRDYLRWLFGCQ